MAGKGYFTSLLWEGSPSRQAPLDWIRQEMARHDVDGDGITDDSDNCPGNSNLNQSDRDGDTHGDACDICPCDPHETDPWRDGDGDGVCGLDCSVDGPVPLDNCQGVHNPDQYNCNAEAELARDALPMGDACDPVPCPGFATLPTEYERVAVRFIGGGYVGCIEETLRFELGPIDVRPPNCGALAALAEGRIDDGQQVVVIPWAEGQWVGVLLSDGSIAPVEERVGAGLMASLSQDWTWLSAVETNPMLGRGASGPSAVALTADGTTVAERMYLAGHRALGTEDMVEVPAPVKLMSTTQATTPPPREGAVGVYAGSAGEVYVMGGEDAGTGELMRDIWWRGVEGGGWHEVPLRSFQPGKVLAATRPYADGKLWILDEVRSGWMRFGRLTRVDPGTGEAEELGKWPRFGLFDQQWLVLDDEGNVVVAASSSMLRKHTLVRIRLDGPSRHVDRVYVGRGVLAMSPWVDASGYALPISQKAGKLPKVVRLETLSGRNGTWGDMGGCL